MALDDYVVQSPRNHIFLIPVPQTVALNFINYTKCIDNFSICEDKKLKKEDIHQVSKQCSFLKYQNVPLENPAISFQRLIPLQTHVRSQLVHCHLHHVLTWFVQYPVNLHHLPQVSPKATVAFHKRIRIVH